MTFATFEDALALAGVREESLSPEVAAALDRDGFVILRGAIPQAWLEPLRERFEALYLPSDKWPMPRAFDTRHADLDNDEVTRRVCLLPAVLAAMHSAFGQRFFLANVQGRDPNFDGGYQALHRDWPDSGAVVEMMVALAFLDDFSAANGATRLISGTHREPGDMSDYAVKGETDPRLLTTEGKAGDILVFHGRLVHGGSRNISGAARRNLQICYETQTKETQTKRAQRPEFRDLSKVTVLERYLFGAEA